MVRTKRNRLRKILLAVILSIVGAGVIYTAISIIQLNFFPTVYVTFSDIDISSISRIEVKIFEKSKIIKTIVDTKTINNTFDFLKKYNGRWSIPFDKKYPSQDITVRFIYKAGFEDGVSFGQDSIIAQGAIHPVSNDEIKDLRTILGI